MVTSSFPSTSYAKMEQELTALPFRMTVQAPQISISQDLLTPVKSSRSRIKSITNSLRRPQPSSLDRSSEIVVVWVHSCQESRAHSFLNPRPTNVFTICLLYSADPQISGEGSQTRAALSPISNDLAEISSAGLPRRAISTSRARIGLGPTHPSANLTSAHAPSAHSMRMA